MTFKMTKWIWLAAIAGLVVVADQVTKMAAREHLAVPIEGLFAPSCNPDGKLEQMTRMRSKSPPVTVIDGYFHLRYVENCGGAFGLFQDASQEKRRPFFFLTSLLAMGFLVYLFLRLGPREKVLMVAFAVIMGGAIGNAIDRVTYTYVVDFIEWHIRDKARWPTFNIADVGITVGLCLILLDSFFLAGRREKQAAQASASLAGGEAPGKK